MDFSDVSIHGLEYAARVAARIQGHLTLCHVQPSVWPEAVFVEDIVSESEQAILSRLETTAHETTGMFHVPCDFLHTRTTNTVEGSIAGLSGAYDLIVMATNGTEDFFEFIFGSHSFHVSRLAQCPVLVVPEGCEQALPEKIVYLHKERINPEADVLLPVWWAQLLGTDFIIWTEPVGDPETDRQNVSKISHLVMGDQPESLIHSILPHAEPQPGTLVPGYMFALALQHHSLASRKILRRVVNTCRNPVIVFEVQS